MPLRPLSDREIEAFISEDEIVWVACREPQFKLTQGKFMAKDETDAEGQKLYSFCPFKRGLKTGFLPADAWLVDDHHDETEHNRAAQVVLAQLFPKK